MQSVKAFFYIGGNDSMDTVLKLSDYAAKIKSDIRIIGVPKTIDNDLCMIDHTPGFGSAAKYIASTMLEIAHDTFIYAVKSVTIVEIMGRDAGWLTAASYSENMQSPYLLVYHADSFPNENSPHNNQNLSLSHAHGSYARAGARPHGRGYPSFRAYSHHTRRPAPCRGSGHGLGSPRPPGLP